jgi:hypothetical protein
MDGNQPLSDACRTTLMDKEGRAALMVPEKLARVLAQRI